VSRIDSKLRPDQTFIKFVSIAVKENLVVQEMQYDVSEEVIGLFFATTSANSSRCREPMQLRRNLTNLP
jgi:hypothetical protein